MNKYEEIIKALREMATYDCGFEEESDTVLQAADALTELCDKVIELTAERDALLKSFTVTSQPIEVIQPKGVVE